jgi:hypothetical protein
VRLVELVVEPPGLLLYCTSDRPRDPPAGTSRVSVDAAAPAKASSSDWATESVEFVSATRAVMRRLGVERETGGSPMARVLWQLSAMPLMARLTFCSKLSGRPPPSLLLPLPLPLSRILLSAVVISGAELGGRGPNLIHQKVLKV